ncbi:MAG: phosphoribosyltransferase family protein [Clostridia bacterium]|nr:phosphoribosyltransferase family protein [Clostridia bacterium]
MKQAMKRLLRALDDLLFPEHVGCLCCGTALGEDERDGLCAFCRDALERQQNEQQERETDGEWADDGLPEGIAFVHAAYGYEGLARRLILALKFSGARDAAVPLARAMAMLPGGEEEVIVPVPTTRRRLRERGYNQAALLARHMGEELGMEVCEALSRRDERAAQATLNRAERSRNLVGCMSSGGQVRGKRVLLVDDVYTTGSTAREAARALYAAGARSVGMFAAARTIKGAKSDPQFLRQ